MCISESQLWVGWLLQDGSILKLWLPGKRYVFVPFLLGKATTPQDSKILQFQMDAFSICESP